MSNEILARLEQMEIRFSQISIALSVLANQFQLLRQEITAAMKASNNNNPASIQDTV
jgi:chaperonin cofactor prefoldin